MKRFISSAIALILLSSSIIVSAHSGGTDAYGGHYDHSTGSYHYHHGFPAHQHPGGKCPYAFGFDDENFDLDIDVPDVPDVPENNNSSKPKEEDGVNGLLVGALAIGGMIPGIIIFINDKFKRK